LAIRDGLSVMASYAHVIALSSGDGVDLFLHHSVYTLPPPFRAGALVSQRAAAPHQVIADPGGHISSRTLGKGLPAGGGGRGGWHSTVGSASKQRQLD